VLRLELGRLDWFGRHGKSGRGHGFGHVKDPSERIPDEVKNRLGNQSCKGGRGSAWHSTAGPSELRSPICT